MGSKSVAVSKLDRQHNMHLFAVFFVALWEISNSCKTWNRLLSGFWLSFLLWADTLPTAVNLWHWSIQCEAKCSLGYSNCPKTANVSSGCHCSLGYTPVCIIKSFPFYPQHLLIPYHPSECMHFLCQWCHLDSNPCWYLVTSYHPGIAQDLWHSAPIIYHPTGVKLSPIDSPQHIQAARVKTTKHNQVSPFASWIRSPKHPRLL